MQQMGIWEMIRQQVTIQQKIVVHTPLEKMQDAFINIMAGGQGMVEVNQRVKPDAALSAAFGRERCADQSGVSTTLNACQAEKCSADATSNADHLSPLWCWLWPSLWLQEAVVGCLI